MTKPTKCPDAVQLTAYVRRDIKDRLRAAAAAKSRPEREVLEEVLDGALPAVSEDRHPKPDAG